MSSLPSVTAIVILNPDWFAGLDKLPQALSSVMWADERLISTSKDSPILQSLGRKYKAKIIPQSGDNFSDWRVNAAHQASQSWIFFIDADEQVTPGLKQEIKALITSDPPHAAYAIPRLNYIFATPMRYGGWWPDYVIRLIKKNTLRGYHGEVHEQPLVSGSIGYLSNHFNHYKHADMEDMVTKTMVWSSTESQLLFDSHHPPMRQYRFIRPFFTEVFIRLVAKQGVRDGIVGIIDGIYQGYSRLITYIKLWELQQTNRRVPHD